MLNLDLTTQCEGSAHRNPILVLKVQYSMLIDHCSMLDTQCSELIIQHSLGTRHSMLHQYSVLSAQYPLLSIQYSMVNTQYSIFSAQNLMLNSQYSVISLLESCTHKTQHPMLYASRSQCIQHSALNTQHPALNTQCSSLSTQHTTLNA